MMDAQGLDSAHNKVLYEAQRALLSNDKKVEEKATAEMLTTCVTVLFSYVEAQHRQTLALESIALSLLSIAQRG